MAMDVARMIDKINAVPYGDIEKMTLENRDYRRVMWTTDNMQMVLMTLPPGDFIDDEVHAESDQFFRVERGRIKVVIEDSHVITGSKNFAFIIPKGTRHMIINNGKRDLQLYTIYSPPHHPSNRIDKVHPEVL